MEKIEIKNYGNTRDLVSVNENKDETHITLLQLIDKYNNLASQIDSLKRENEVLKEQCYKYKKSLCYYQNIASENKTKINYNEILLMRKNGYTWSDVAKEYNISRTTLMRYLEKNKK